MSRLKGKKALITGLASGIGAACAERFIREGAAVAGMDSNPLPKELQKTLGASVMHCQGDVRSEKDIQQAVEQAVDALGGLDILINSAGVGSGGPTGEIAMEEWERVMDINVKGSFLAAKHVIPHMVKQGGGSIVNLGSIEGMEGFNASVVYGTSKGAVIQMSRDLAVDLAEHGIRVNCVCPGAIDTPLTAILKGKALLPIRRQMEKHHLMHRFGRPEEIANAILFLASDEASFVTGLIMPVDGGYTAGRRYDLSSAEAWEGIDSH